MAKITEESRERFETRTTPYRELIKKYQAREKMLLDKIKQSESGTALTKIQLVEDAIYIATIYIIINKVSVAILETKNNEALEQARKSIMRANIYLGEVVTKLIDAPYSEYSEKLEELDSYSVEKRFYLVSKLGLAIDMLVEEFGENTKWRWVWVDLRGDYATVAKNLLNMAEAGKNYFDPNQESYETTVRYVRLLRDIFDDSAEQFRNKYELSSRRVDDMRKAIQYTLALKRIYTLMGDKVNSEEMKKKAEIWRIRMDSDQKEGRSN